MTKNKLEQFDPIQFLDDLIGQMGMQNEPPDKLQKLKEGMAEALHQSLFQAAAENIEPEVIDDVMERYADEENAWFLMTKLMQSSPAAQVAMLLALEEFQNNTLDVFNSLKK